MGFWDVRLADLEAAGEVFSPEEIRGLEHGGQVLHLHPLETPDVETNDWCAYPDGEIVLIPEILTVYGPEDEVPTVWQGWSEGGRLPSGTTVAQYLDLNHTYRGDRSSWTDVPSYAGEVTSQHDIHSVRCEEFTTYVYWNCYPLVTKRDQALAEQIVAVMPAFLDRSMWHQVELMCRAWYDYEYDPIDVWGVLNHPEVYEPGDIDDLYNTLEYTYGPHAEEEAKWQASAVQDLLDAKVIDLTHHLAKWAHGEDCVPMPWARVTDLLEEKGWYDAADLYRRITARRRATLARFPSPANYRGFTENEVRD